MADLISMLAACAGGGEKDPNFKQTVLLLHGDGTNGAQNNTFLDGSTNNFTITRNGNTTQGTFSPFSVGAGEWSNYFDGTGDFLSIANNAALDLGTGDFTIEGWCYFTDTSDQALVSKYQSGAGYVVQYQASNTTLRLVLATGSPGSDVVYSFTWALVPNSWNHIAITRSGTSGRAFVNGTQIGTTQTLITNNAGAAQPLQIGSTQTVTQLTRGYVSNFRLVKGTAVYTSAFTPPTTPLTNITNTSLLTCQSNRFVDNSTNAFAITRNGDVRVTPFSPFAPSAAYDPSVNGGSGYFDGTGDYLSFTDTSNNLDLGGAQASLEMWVYFLNTTTLKILYTKGGGANSYSTSNGIEYVLLVESGLVKFFYNNAGSAAGITGSVVNNAWNHIVIATDASNNIALFVNGTRASTASNAISKPTTRTSIRVAEGFAGGEAINAYISNIRNINGANAYDPTQTTLTVPTAPLTAITNTQLLLNFTNAGIFDNTGKNNLETVGDAQIDTTTKKFGTGSMEFDGTGDWLDIPSTPDLYLSTGDFTIEGWVYTNNSSVNQQIMIRRASAAARGIAGNINASSANKLTFVFGDTNTAAFEVTLTSTTSLSNNVWYHFAVVRSGNNFALYINGVSEATATSSVVIADDTSKLRIGADDSGTSSLNGFIDDLRITKGVARYDSNFNPPTAAFPNE